MPLSGALLPKAITRAILVRWLIVGSAVGMAIPGCAHYAPRPLAPEQTAVALEARTLADPGLRTFVERSSGHEVAEWPPVSWNLELLTLAAFYYSPELDVARAQRGVADAAVVTAGMRPNPALSITPDYATHVSPGIPPWLSSIAVDVPIETAGKRGHRVTQAHQLSESARWSVVTAAWEVRRKLTGALLDYTVARHRESLSMRQLDLQTAIVQLQEGEVAAGAAAASDVTAARIQLARIRLDLQAIRAQVTDSRSQIAQSLGVPLRALDGANMSFEFDSADAPSLTSEEARRSALQSRSDVMAALADYEATQAALQLEIAKQYPDIHLGPGYQYDQGQNDWFVALTVELPAFNRNQGPIAEATARRTEAVSRFIALQASIVHEIDAAISALKAAQEASLAGQELLAVQRRHLQTMDMQVAAGAVGALEVAAARIEAANAETLVFEATVRRQQAMRVLEDAVQRPLGAEADAHATVLQIQSTQRSPR
ncbi:MAG: Outer rane efflux protein [Gammaproteobacteria bacterium]|nr:Outer rane efflux protein [Gammaproteobacteria bacterium]